MRTGMLTPWAIVEEVAITPDDLGPDGRPNEGALLRWLSSGWSAYLNRCTALHDEVRDGRIRLSIGALRLSHCRQVGPATGALIATGLTEMRPSSLDMALRIRTLGSGDDPIADGRFSVEFRDGYNVRLGIPPEIRRALLAVEAAASHYC
jgi:acyl-CoA thioesterase FadM